MMQRGRSSLYLEYSSPATVEHCHRIDFIRKRLKEERAYACIQHQGRALAEPNRAGRRRCFLAAADTLACLTSSGPKAHALSFSPSAHIAVALKAVRHTGADVGSFRG